MSGSSSKIVLRYWVIIENSPLFRYEKRLGHWLDIEEGDELIEASTEYTMLWDDAAAVLQYTSRQHNAPLDHGLSICIQICKSFEHHIRNRESKVAIERRIVPSQDHSEPI